MEEKRTQIHHFFRTFFGHGNPPRIFSSNSTRSAISSLSGLDGKGFIQHQAGAGFTLIELLVVIALLGILTATAMFIINPALQLQKSRDAKRKSDIKLIQSALELYRSDTGSYVSPNPNTSPGVGNCSTNGYASLFNDTQGDSGCTTLNIDTVYLQTVPKDPKTSNDYFYCQGAGCPSGSGVSANGYAIYACLENPNDSERLKSTVPSVPAFLNDATLVGCSTSTTAVYGVSNP